MAASATPSAAGVRARSAATFEEYYWEAYNEIVRPNRFDWYLITRWLPTLGPDGFALVKVLRSLCYHNPREGILRNECDIAMADLAAACGIKERTLYRLLSENEAVAQFVQRQARYIVGRNGSEDAPHRAPSRFRVCMDDPIHPGDWQEYEELRCRREQERAAPADTGKPIIERPEPHACQYGGHSNAMPANMADIGAGFGRHIPPMPANMAEHKERDLPSGDSLLKDLTASPVDAQARPAPQPKGLPPEGEGSHAGRDGRHGSAGAGDTDSPDPLSMVSDTLCVAWQQALVILNRQLNKPTFEAHIRTLRPLSQEQDTATPAGAVVTLACPSAFTREWIMKRHEGHLQEALASALGEAVQVRLVLESA